ncbi:MAG: DNA primase family protein [Bacteroidota bacterium]
MKKENTKNHLPENQKINLESLVNEEQKYSKITKSNSEIFEFICANFSKINFAIETGVDSEKKVRKKDELVIIIDKLLDKAKELKLGLCSVDGKTFVYNRFYWSEVNEADLQDFLAKIARKSGLGKTDAEYYKFKMNLYEQFMSSSRLEKKANTKTLINLNNGTLEIKSNKFKLRDYDPDDFLTYRLNFDYDPEEKSPMFQSFIDDVLPDKSLQKILAEYIGSVFIPNSELKLEKVLFLYGTGSNGKSVVFEIIQALLGTNNVSSISLSKLTTCPNARLQLQNKLLNFSSEKGDIGDIDTFKKLVSREPIDVKVLYQNISQMYNYAKLMFNCNDFIKKNEYTNGYFRRFLFIPFDKTIKEKDQDKKLATKIIANELPGILNWILEGAVRLYENENFSPSKRSDELLKTFRRESDSVMMFKEDFELKPSTNEVNVTELFNKYREFCFSNGFKPCARNTFSTRLKSIGFTKKRKNTGYVFFLSHKF